MALPVTYFLADVDGVLCVAARQTDWTEPRYVVNYWPTAISVRDWCFAYECAPGELRERFAVGQSMPGEFHVREGGSFGRSRYVGLVSGAQTRSVRTTFEEVARPRVGKGSRLEWMDGRWVKETPKGGRVVILV